MGQARKRAIEGDEPSRDEVEFTCRECIRPEDIPDLPRLDEEGEPLNDSEIWGHYNDRRYQHYLDDFSDARDLRDHLTQRERWWNQGKPKVELEIALKSVDATLEWWRHARAVREAEATAILEKVKAS